MSAGPYRKHLDVIEVKKPCRERWDRMEGDDFVRFCRVCEQNVYDLSARSRDEAEELLRLYEGAVCVRFRRRADGTVATTDCAGARPAHRRRLARRAARAAAVGAGVAGLVTTIASAAASTSAPSASEPETTPLHPVAEVDLDLGDDGDGFVMGQPVSPYSDTTGPTWVDPDRIALDPARRH